MPYFQETEPRIYNGHEFDGGRRGSAVVQFVCIRGPEMLCNRLSVMLSYGQLQEGEDRMAKRWLFKEEPSHYSFDDLLKDERTRWDGVRNNLALKHLRSAAKGDRFYFYHTGKERAIVGIGRIISDPYPDPEADDPRFVVVDVEPLRRLRNPVTLKTIKQNPAFKEFALVRISRLSVMPVDDVQWRDIEALSR